MEWSILRLFVRHNHHIYDETIADLDIIEGGDYAILIVTSQFVFINKHQQIDARIMVCIATRLRATKEFGRADLTTEPLTDSFYNICPSHILTYHILFCKDSKKKHYPTRNNQKKIHFSSKLCQKLAFYTSKIRHATVLRIKISRFN